MKKFNVVCCTGHRPQDLFGFDLSCKEWQDVKSRMMKTLVECNCHYAISGMALGADLIFASAVLALKASGYDIKLECAVPCKGQEKNWKDILLIQSYYKILKKADKVVYLSDKYTKECMQNRNKYMVNKSDAVIAVWNGKESGGTYNTIKYAKKVNKPIINILDVTRVVDLKRKMFQGNDFILNKYFVNNKGFTLNNFHIPELDRDMFNAYKSPKLEATFEDASDYAKNNIIKAMIRKDFNLKYISLEDYVNDERYHQYNDDLVNFEVLEDDYRNNDDNVYESYETYFKLEPRIGIVDIRTFNSLYRFCINCLKHRIAMLLDISNVINLLIDIENYTYGLKENCTSDQAAMLEASFRKCMKLAEDKEVISFIKAGNTDLTVFASDESTKQMYIDYYKQCIRMLTDIRSTDFEYFRPIISNVADTLEDEIIANEDDFQIESYIENQEVLEWYE